MTFETATAVQQQDAQTYQAEFVDDWCIGSVPHGGYVTATIMRTVQKHFETTLSKQNQPHTLALHVNFLRRTQTGPATVSIRNVKLGRQTSIVHITLTQGQGQSREEVVGYVTQSNLSLEKGHSYDTHWSPRPERLPLTSTTEALLAGKDPVWSEKLEWPNAGFRKATKQIRAWFPRMGQPERRIYDMWVCLRDEGSRWTNASLGFLVDMFPQVLESFYLKGFDQYDPKLDEYFPKEELQRLTRGKAPFWYPTLLLNLEVKKALPEEGVRFLFSRLQTKVIKDGRYDLEVVIMDEGGDVVALSHHVCFALSAERNLAKRREGGEKL